MRLLRKFLGQRRFLTLIFLGAAMAVTAPATAGEITVTNTITIPPCRKWNPKFWFGNEDDPLPPPDYRPADKHRVMKWYFRNPTHNFNFYVIGLADKTFQRSGRFPAEVFSPKQGWNWAVCKYRWWRLPFISYHRNSFRFYFGWRERGNFGIKFTFREDTAPEARAARVRYLREIHAPDKGAWYLAFP